MSLECVAGSASTEALRRHAQILSHNPGITVLLLVAKRWRQSSQNMGTLHEDGRQRKLPKS